MDPFEEFEFKPLTEGLGFHKKPEVPQAAATPTKSTTRDLNAEIAKMSSNQEQSRQKSKSISDLIAALPPSLDFLDEGPAKETPSLTSAGTPAKTTSNQFRKSIFGETAAQAVKPAAIEPDSRPQIFQPLGRKEYAPASAPTTAVSMSAPISEVPMKNKAGNMPSPTLRSPISGSVGNTDYSRSFPHLDKKPAVSIQKDKTTSAAQAAPVKILKSATGLRKVSASLSAAILDAMVITGFATIFLVSILLITEVDLVAMLSNAATDIATYGNLALLFFIVMHLYMLSSRGVFGATLGEWAFDMQLGTSAEQRKPLYYGKIIWRMILMAATGFILLPILSKLSRRDLAAALGAPQLYVRG